MLVAGRGREACFHSILFSRCLCCRATHVLLAMLDLICLALLLYSATLASLAAHSPGWKKESHLSFFLLRLHFLYCTALSEGNNLAYWVGSSLSSVHVRARTPQKQDFFFLFEARSMQFQNIVLGILLK